MRKISLSTLLWLVSACAVLVLVLTTQRTIRIKSFQISELNSENETLRDRLGDFGTIQDDEYCIKYFKDPYTSDRGFRESRWRIHVPDASLCNVFYAVGKIPDSGFPETRIPLLSKPLSKEPADWVLIVEGGVGHEEIVKQFRLALYPEFASKENNWSFSYGNSQADWLPFDKADRTLERPAMDATSIFSLEEPFVVMKDYSINDEGEKIGYMIWLDRFRPD